MKLSTLWTVSCVLQTPISAWARNVWQPPSNLEEPQVAGDDSAGAPFVVKRDMGELRGSDEELPVVIYPPHEYVGPAEHGVSDTEASATEEQQQSQNDAQGSI